MKRFIVGLKREDGIYWRTEILAEDETQAKFRFVFYYGFHKTKNWDKDKCLVNGQEVVIC